MGVGSVGPVLHSSKAALLVSTTQDFQIFSPVLLKPHIVVGPFFFTSDAVFHSAQSHIRLVCSAGVNTPSFYIFSSVHIGASYGASFCSYPAVDWLVRFCVSQMHFEPMSISTTINSGSKALRGEVKKGENEKVDIQHGLDKFNWCVLLSIVMVTI